MKSKEANIIFVLKKLIDKVVIYLLFHVSLAKLKFPSIVWNCCSSSLKATYFNAKGEKKDYI